MTSCRKQILLDDFVLHSFGWQNQYIEVTLLKRKRHGRNRSPLPICDRNIRRLQELGKGKLQEGKVEKEG